jgi:hypothetical protein
MSGFYGAGPWGAGSRWCGWCLGGGGLVNAVILGIGIYAVTRLLRNSPAQK